MGVISPMHAKECKIIGSIEKSKRMAINHGYKMLVKWPICITFRNFFVFFKVFLKFVFDILLLSFGFCTKSKSGLKLHFTYYNMLLTQFFYFLVDFFILVFQNFF